MRTALAGLAERNDEHPDCWLSDENGMRLPARSFSTVVLENVEAGEGPWHMKGQKPEAVLGLWRLLKAGDIAAIHVRPWLEGLKRSRKTLGMSITD